MLCLSNTHVVILGMHPCFSPQTLNLDGRRVTTNTFPPFPVFCGLQGFSKLHSRRFFVFIFPFLLLSSSPCSFHCPCRIVFGMPEDIEMWPYQLRFRFFTKIRRSSCLDSAANVLVHHIVFVGNVQKYPIASHLKGLDSSFKFCSQGPALKNG